MSDRERVRQLKTGPDPVVVYMQVRDAPSSEQGQAVDPVCGRELEAGFIAGRLIHRGVEYGFCSLGCARIFAARPAEFV